MTHETTYDLFIIGGGPAGLTAALYAARACLKTAFIEKNITGGKLMKTMFIENYPGYVEQKGPELGDYMLKQVLDNGVTELEGEVISIEKQGNIWHIKDSQEKTYRSKTILIASGMKERVLEIPNVKEYYGNGISYCAICDGNIYKNKPVIVVGGGNSAVEESIYLSEIVSEVNLVHRRREFRADAILVKKMQSIGNIKVNTPYVPVEVVVQNDKVCGLKVKNTETEEEKIIPSDCVFFYVGLIPENNFLSNLNVEKDEYGFIKVDKNMKTNIDGLYAAGDITHKELRQVVTAVNDGAIAAIAIKNYLNSEIGNG